MNPISLVPAFRIEISEQGSGNAWFIADLAHTELHAKGMIERWHREKGITARTVPNRQPLPATFHPGANVTAKSLRERGPLALEQADTRPIPPGVATAGLVAPTPAAAAAPATNPGALALTEPVAAVPDAQIPFAVGDRIRDKFAPDHPEMRVTALRPTGPKPGFFWESPAHPRANDRKGFCPLESVGAFEKFPEEKPGDSPKTAESTKESKPAEAATEAKAPEAKKTEGKKVEHKSGFEKKMAQFGATASHKKPKASRAAHSKRKARHT